MSINDLRDVIYDPTSETDPVNDRPPLFDPSVPTFHETPRSPSLCP